MWQAAIQETGERFQRYSIHDSKGRISYRDWIEGLTNSTDLAIAFNNILKNNPFESFFWEVKPVTKIQLDSAFEFVVVESIELNKIKADPSDFQQYFQQGNEVVTFSNLGGDAQLIVPTDQNCDTKYGHIAEFVRSASSNQIVEFWRMVVIEFCNQLGEKPKWLSTSGLGVYWLHVRVDSRPKYYQYESYKNYEL